MVAAQSKVRHLRPTLDATGIPSLRAVRVSLEASVDNKAEPRASANARWTEFESARLRRHYAFLIANQLNIRISDGASLRKLSLNLALGIQFDGSKDFLALDPTAAFFGNLRERGVESVHFAVLETSGDLHHIFAAQFPESHIEGSVAQLVRESSACVALADRASVAAALRGILRQPDLESALLRLETFAVGKLGRRYPTIAVLWRQRWDRIASQFGLPVPLRRFLETVDAVEAFQEKLQRQAVCLPTAFKNEQAAIDTLHSLARSCAGGWRVAPGRWMRLMAHCPVLRDLPISSN